jgi:dynein heavy chain, axonemal
MAAKVTGQTEWLKLVQEGDLPCPRSGHSLTIVGRRLVLFGGIASSDEAQSGTFLGDIYSCDSQAQTMKWRKIPFAGAVAPEARWRHTAAAFSENSLLIFGGCGDKKRFCDVWILEFGKDEGTWREVECTGAIPFPRSEHSMTRWDKKTLLIFGGYGGSGQAKSYMNDLVSLDTETWEWTKANVKGAVARCRGGHSANVIDGKRLSIVAGRDHKGFLNDVQILDFDPSDGSFTWSTTVPVNGYLSSPRSNHLMAAIESVPCYKMFTFGGQVGHDDDRKKWELTSQLVCVDTGEMSNGFYEPPYSSMQRPCIRSDAAWDFEKKGSRLIMFGGWSNKFLNDMYSLDVSGIVGPPYAVKSLEPFSGPLSGNTKLIISGMNFPESPQVQVMFTNGKNQEIVKGDFISSSKISCESPSWDKYGAGDVEVRVSVRGEGFTVNRVRWTYYINTKPQKCTAFGPGIFEETIWGFPASFLIQAKDMLGKDRLSGGDEFTVHVKHESDDKKLIPVSITDLKDGTHDVSYIPRKEGKYTIQVSYLDPVQGGVHIDIRGSPWTMNATNPWSNPKLSGVPPRYRLGVSSAPMAKRMVVYGGNSDSVDVLDTESWKWSAEKAGGGPGLRMGHSFISSEKDRLVLYGGADCVVQEEGKDPKYGDWKNDGYVLTVDKDGSWKWVGTGALAGMGPPPRSQQSISVITVGKKVLIFGGKNASDSKVAGDTHMINASVIEKLEWVSCAVTELVLEEEVVSDVPDGEEKPARRNPLHRHSAATFFDNNQMIVFGGNHGSGLLNDVLVASVDIKLNAIKWSQIQTKGTPPSPRSNSTITLSDNKFYVYGGDGPQGIFYDELFTLDPESWTWNCLYASDQEQGSNTIRSVITKRVVAISCSRNSWDELKVLEYGKRLESNSLLPRMSSYMSSKIKELDGTLQKYLTDLAVDPSKESSDEKQLAGLLKVMNGIFETKLQGPAFDLEFDVIIDAIKFLTKSGVNVDRQKSEVTDVFEKWSEVKKAIPRAREVIRPVKDREASKVKQQIQVFTDKVKEDRKKFDAKPFFKYDTGSDQAYKDIAKSQSEILQLNSESKTMTENSRVFEFPELMKASHDMLAKMQQDLVKVKQLWDFVAQIKYQFDFWKNTLWSQLDCETIEEGGKALMKNMRVLDKSVKITDVYMKMEESVKQFLAAMPLIADLRNPCLRERHWNSVKKVTKTQFTMDAKFKLLNLTDLGLQNFEEDISEICTCAQKEERMELALKKISEIWATLEFEFTKHKDTDLFLIRLKEEDFDILEDHQVQVQNMMSSRYLATFEEQVTSWQKKLATVSDVVQIMTEIQRTWAYLETLFIGSEEVKKELPEDTSRFAGIDVTMKKTLRSIKASKNAIEGANAPGCYEDMEDMQSKLELCEKSLANYLENKRRVFPRFFFVSTADLLDILSNGNNPSKVMGHMSKIIAAVGSMDLKEDSSGARPFATGLDTCVGQERFDFIESFQLVGRVEIYLQTVIEKIQVALRAILTESNQLYAKMERPQWALKVPNQIMLSTTLIYYNLQVEEVFVKIGQGNANAFKDYLKQKQLELTTLIDLVRTDITKGERQKVMCLITLDAHSRDIIENLIEQVVTDVKAFQWQSQLRFTWNTQLNDCMINICDAEFHYAFEYQGNGPRLVITPLTDRIYVTATQALHLCMGCAPAGPAGTGKTESTKDLAAMIGKCIYVFNCAPEMDYRSLGDIFKGLAASGAWGCFDEFNRLIAEVLSVCSTQYKCVLDAVKARREDFTLMGATLKLNLDCGAFITMNPGYAGRQELPESLKVLFRPVTVVVPDMGLICENMLMAEGFTVAKALARKFVQLYALLRDLLSKAMHYDWGLRAIKSVLVVAGSFKRAEPTVDEMALLFRALRDFNLPKIVGDDLVVFVGLLGDLFPGIEILRKRDMNLEKKIEEATTESGLQCEDDFILKTVQLYELLGIRHCVFMIGTSGTGKSQIWSMLAKAQTAMGQRTTLKNINPKSISCNEFYGYIQLSTREWKDGIFSSTMRDLAALPDTNPKYLILDGDLDTNWIESMNSVMDDNKLLTLASNERINLKPHMRIIFEVRDLRFASPATVSRAGILYVTETKQWRSYVESWIAKREDDLPDRKAYLLSLFDMFVPESIKAIRREMDYLVPTLDFSLTQNLCAMLSNLLTLENIPKGTPDDKKIVETYFAFAVVWAFGGPMSTKDGVDQRKKFSNWFKTKWTSIKFPGKNSVFDFFVDKATYKLTPWSQIVPEVSFDSLSQNMNSLTIPTTETVAVLSFMDRLVEAKKPVLLVGPAGCGKTAIVLGKLRTLDDSFMYLTINFNYYTDSPSLQRVMESVLEKKAGKNYGPPGAKKLIYFVDDLNMPQLDKYDTQTPIALLRQHIDSGGFYDRAKMTEKKIGNTQYLACMNPSAGSFVINPRLQRHFVVFAMGFPQAEALMTIFATFLNGHCKQFSEKIADASFTNKIIQAALELHTRTGSEFRKTAINFHYEFSIRHISSVFSGMLMSTPVHIQDAGKFAGLWCHESERVYADRLVSETDIAKFQKVLKDVGKKFFKDLNQAEVFAEPNLFCNCWKDLEDKSYNRVESMEKLRLILEDGLTRYNENNAAMDLVLFEDAMKHVARICRIFQRGNALLVGVGGSGKQSLARLSAFICNCSVSQIAISGTYGVADLKEDLKVMYMKAGVKGEGVVFLFTDSQIADERFLVFLNELLASGNIPDLFPNDEVEGICNSVRNAAKSEGVKDQKDTLYEFFITKIVKNLHVALCFSPVGEAFRRRASRFPSLINCTAIDWFQPWPEDALHSVARRFLNDVDLGEEKTKESIIKFMPFSFQLVNKASADYLQTERRYNYTTPKSFLELIYLYKNMLASKRAVLFKQIDRLESGLTKLQKTAADVNILEEELKIKAVEVAKAKEAADELMEKVGAEKAKVGEEARKAGIEAEVCAGIAERAGIQQRDCEADLAKAEPAVKAAEAALDTLNKKDLGELKSLGKPPAGVDDITAAILAMRGEKDRTWNAAKVMMKDVNGFIVELKAVKKQIDDGVVKMKDVDACRPYLALEHFTAEAMERKSKAAAGLCVFVLNIVMYFDVVISVEPKRESLRIALSELEAANTKLAETNAFVADLNATLAKLEAEFNVVVDEKNRVVAEAAKLQSKLDMAQRLMNALGSEGDRWTNSIKAMKVQTELIVGDVLMASAFISYVGCFNKKYRDLLINKKFAPFFLSEKIPTSPDIDPLKLLCDSATIAGWSNQGLPSDRVSVENAAIVTTAERWPLLIDPQLQAVVWVREKESKNSLQSVRMGAKQTLNVMERALENGYTVMLENIQESVDAVLAPIIGRKKIKKGRNFLVKVGEKDVEWNSNFKLILQTKLSNPHYPPEIQAECTLINFTVTEVGLEDQLLAKVVGKERPDLEEQKSALIRQQNEFRIKLKELEDGLLKQLSESKGDILEDVDLIVSLEAAKALSVEISEKVIIAQETEIKINEAREFYRKIAARSALLFFILGDLNKVHTFYHYSLAAFTQVFLRAIDQAGKAAAKPALKASAAMAATSKNSFKKFKWICVFLNAGIKGKTDNGKPRDINEEVDVSVRVPLLLDCVTYAVFEVTRRGLLEKHKLLFASFVTLKILDRDGLVNDKEQDFLIAAKKSLTPPAMASADTLTWVTESQWASCAALQDVCAPLSKICTDIEVGVKFWKPWVNEEQPERCKLPGEYDNITVFQKLLVLRALRPDRVPSALREYISKMMGLRYIQQAPFNVAQSYKETSPGTALFFYLFPGADCVKDLEPLLLRKGYSIENGKFHNISMGQGQEPVAEQAMDLCMKNGGWVFLQNIHLMSVWIKALERKLESTGGEGVHPDFRVFLSAEPPGDPQFQLIPESIMQNSIKLANEPPSDIKNNLLRAWNNFDDDFLNKPEPSKRKNFKAVMLALSLFHSLVQGRRRFGCQGWSRAYGFNTGDLTQCADVLVNQIAGAPLVPWIDLKYIFGEIMYGGHITDRWDRRTNNEYLNCLLQEAILAGGELIPGFKCTSEGDFFGYTQYINSQMPHESPILFGLHPNAEIDFLTAEQFFLFSTIQELTGGKSGGGGSGGKDEVVAAAINDFLTRLPENFNVFDINLRITDKTPYLVVLMQEIERMNTLTSEIRRSLVEAKLGLEGALNISDAMEALMLSLTLNRIPANWVKEAYFSLKGNGI